MKRTNLLALSLAGAMALSLAACGTSTTGNASSSASSAPAPVASGTAATSSAAAASAPEFSDAAWLPAGIEQLKSETKANPELAKAIIDYYQIPDDALATTRYYYNYVDLNDDGTDEILAVVSGPYTSGSGGDSMLWVMPNADMAVSQAFTLVHMPIIVTDEMVNGAKQLVMQRYGGGANTEIVELTCSDGQYTNVSDGKVLENVDGIKGTAILYNDYAADTESGNFLTLAK